MTIRSYVSKIKQWTTLNFVVIEPIFNQDSVKNHLGLELIPLKLCVSTLMLFPPIDRHQFPESPVQKPIIPSWQLEESLKADLSANSNKKERLNSDEGSEGAPPVSSQQGAQSNTGTHSGKIYYAFSRSV